MVAGQALAGSRWLDTTIKCSFKLFKEKKINHGTFKIRNHKLNLLIVDELPVGGRFEIVRSFLGSLRCASDLKLRLLMITS